MFHFRDPAWRRRAAVMLFGIVLMGIGVSLFKLSLMGNDPSSAMVMAIGNIVNRPFSIMLVIVNSIWFIFELILGRKHIGVGTFVNWFCVGIFTDLWTKIITENFTVPHTVTARLIIMAFGVLILSLSAALYQTAALGIAPYDALSIIMADRFPIPYFWCRIITDSVCAALAFFLGGIIGIGTLVCALGLGPFINFFSNTIAKKLCGISSAKFIQKAGITNQLSIKN